MPQFAITTRDGSAVTLSRIGPDAWEVHHEGSWRLVIERVTAWGWSVHDGEDYQRPWMSVREALAARQVDLSPATWAEAVAAFFDEAAGPPQL